MDFDYVKILVTTVLAVLGWITAHYFAAQRTLAAKRRDITLEHLINAYRVLTNDISQRKLDDDRQKKFEDLLSDIQLFGSTEQVNLARQLADKAASENHFELDPLINNLRDDLRAQLQLDAVSGNVQWLRYKADSHETSTNS